MALRSYFQKRSSASIRQDRPVPFLFAQSYKLRMVVPVGVVIHLYVSYPLVNLQDLHLLQYIRKRRHVPWLLQP